MRKQIEASNPTREKADDLFDSLIAQGVSEHDMLTELFKKLSADDALYYLEDIAKDFNIDLDDEIEFSTDIRCNGRSKSDEDELREKWYTPENYPEVTDLNRFKELLNISWNDVTAEDSEEFLLNEDDFPVLKNIKSVRYFDAGEDAWAEENDYNGGYVITFSKPAGDVKYAAWIYGDPKLYDVSEDIEYDIGNKAYRDATKENDFAVVTEDYNNRIAEEAYGKDINSSSSVSPVHTSTVSFDFIHDGYYNGDEIISTVMDVLAENGVNPLGGSFESVDYSGYSEYADKIVSQCSVDFEWAGDYDGDVIEDSIVIALMPLGVIGLEFRSLED